ncbi:unnamed protein product [Brassicogethes aeneus]|uniref:DUF4806 domain-containing protein n=1 Tax=Brassicogethes aeneus TaxID=1431903 RepID=A0A9P0FFT3_BRAAE|nr:unnamed protein product [Brassicogethes aeneus]
MEKDSPSWTVIQFIDDRSVEAVPSCWIQGDYCHWPSYSKEKLVSAIRKCEPLNTCWSIFKVKLFRGATFDDYMIARNKAKVAEDTSDLNTADENENPKRKRVQKILSSSDSDQSSENDCVLPLPPKLSKTRNKQSNSQSAVEIPRNKKKFQESQTHFEQIDLNENDMFHGNPSVNLHQCSNCDNKDLKTIIQQNHVLRGMLTDVLQEVKLLREQKENQNINDQEIKNSIFKCPGITFPINTDDEFEILENYLSVESDFESAVVELSKIGGSSPYDLIKRIMTLLVSNNQTLKYSWLGRKGKKAFNKSKIAAALIKSVQKSGIGKDNKEVEVAIQAWLRRASDRRLLLAKKF